MPPSTSLEQADAAAPAPQAAGGSAGASVVRDILPSARRVRVRDVFASLTIATVFALRDFQSRYKQSLLGPVWLIVQPLTMIAGFTVIFGGVAEIDSQGVPYVLFSTVGITVWLTFQMAVLYGTRCIVANKGIVKSLPVPRVAFVTATLLGSLPQFVFMVVLSVISVLVAGIGIGPHLLLLPVCIAWLLVFCYVVVLPLCTWHVRYRDVGATVPFLFQAGLFLSPVAYPITEAPPTLATFLELNPISGLIELWRFALLGTSPSELALVAGAVWTVALGLFGWRTFARAEVRFADVV